MTATAAARMIRPSTAAKLLGVTPPGVGRMMARGALRVVRTGDGAPLLFRRDVLRMAAARKAARREARA